MGQQDSCLVLIPDPEPDENYYFAMKTADEVPNWSPLSRIVKAMKIDQVLVVFPDNITIGRDEDDSLILLSYAWVWVRLYRGVTPIDSVKIRLHDE